MKPDGTLTRAERREVDDNRTYAWAQECLRTHPGQHHVITSPAIGPIRAPKAQWLCLSHGYDTGVQARQDRAGALMQAHIAETGTDCGTCGCHQLPTDLTTEHP